MKIFFHSLGKLVGIVFLCCVHLHAKEVDKTSILDAIALQSCFSHKDTYIALLFPCVHGHHEKIKKLFRCYGKIVYKKTVNLKGNGPLNLLKIAYKNFTMYYNLKKRFTIQQPDGSYQLKVVVFKARSLKKVVRCKKKIRDLFRAGNNPIHINDTHEETLELAQALLIPENLHFINTEKFKGKY